MKVVCANCRSWDPTSHLSHLAPDVGTCQSRGVTTTCFDVCRLFLTLKVIAPIKEEEVSAAILRNLSRT